MLKRNKKHKVGRLINMNRKIKFRGMTFQNEWVCGNLCVQDGVHILNDCGTQFIQAVQPETVEQFTNLYAKDIEIYENDIITFEPDFENTRGVVKFVDDGWAVVNDVDEYIMGLWNCVNNYGARVIKR